MEKDAAVLAIKRTLKLLKASAVYRGALFSYTARMGAVLKVSQKRSSG